MIWEIPAGQHSGFKMAHGGRTNVGSPGRGGHGQGKSGSAGYFGDLKKGGKRMLNTAIEKISEGVAYIWEGPPGVCPQCRGRVPPELEGDFCSMKCYDQYWRDYRNHRICATGRREALCRFPGCDKPCYVDTYRVHDYCGKTHAQEHQRMMGGAPPEDQVTRCAPSYWRAKFDFRTGPIRFYNRDNPYYEFTNFYRAKINLDGKCWPTSEHYFQAQKFLGTPYVEEIRNLPTARTVFDRSRSLQVFRWCRKDWEEVKIEVMYKALLAKFSQNEELKDLLGMTGNRVLIEDSPHDSYWGNGGDGTGHNMLGKLLMKVREELRGNSTPMPHPQSHSLGPVRQRPVITVQPHPQHPQGPPPPDNEGQVTGTGQMVRVQRQNSGGRPAIAQSAFQTDQYTPAPPHLGRTHSGGGNPPDHSTDEPMDTSGDSKVTKL